AHGAAARRPAAPGLACDLEVAGEPPDQGPRGGVLLQRYRLQRFVSFLQDDAFVMQDHGFAPGILLYFIPVVAIPVVLWRCRNANTSEMGSRVSTVMARIRFHCTLSSP